MPISRMVPRSWITNFDEGQRIAFAPTVALGGIAMGGDRGVARVAVSADGGGRWYPATLGPERGKYGFRRWDARVPLTRRGPTALMARCWNDAGIAQPPTPNWNPGGYMRGTIETTMIVVG